MKFVADCDCSHRNKIYFRLTHSKGQVWMFNKYTKILLDSLTAAKNCYKMYCLISVGSIFIAAILIIKVIQRFIWVWDSSSTCLVGKTAIVTGANTGIGYFVAQDFAKRGAKVILACRNESKAKIAQSKIIEATGNPNILTFTLDLSSLASVRKFVDRIKETQKELHILVNNAGALYLKDDLTGDGINPVKQVNYVGPFLLTVLLLDLLKSSAPSRIVSYASITGHIVKIDSNSLNSCNNKMLDYGQSKLLVMLFMNELASRLKGTGVVANSINPGETYTDIARNLPPIIEVPGKLFRKIFFKNVELGAQTPIYVAVSKDTENVTGKYFDNCRESRFPSMPKIAHDLKLRREIFEKTLKIAKLNAEEMKQLNNLFASSKQ